MSRTKQDLNKTSQAKLKKFAKSLAEYDYIEDKDKFIKIYRDILTSEVRSLKTCSERAVIDYYMEAMTSALNKNHTIDPDFFDKVKISARGKIAHYYTDSKTFDNNIDIYFNDVKREYIKCPQTESDNLEFLPENRDIFIKNNLKLVINCAKRYQNLGLPFEDLIQIGNYGLLVAFDKFDKDRANLRVAINKEINESPLESFTLAEAEDVIKSAFVYASDLETTLNKLPDNGFASKQEFFDWTKKNIKTAVFASVAFQWIRAYIFLELNKLSKIVRVPKSFRTKVDEETGEQVNKSITIINLDSLNPYTDDCYHDNELSEITQEEFILEDEYIDNMEKQETFTALIEKAMYNLPALDRRIIKKRFGIGMPYQLSINEIAESENINANKVKYSITSSLKVIGNSFSDSDKELIMDMLS